MIKKDPILSSFGNNLRAQRKQKSLSQERLAERADLDVTYISGIENGRRNPGIRNVVLLAKALRIHPSEFFTGL